MEEVTLEQIKRKFDSLPENLRLAIIVAGADKKINEIGREHGLNVKQIADLLLKTHIMMFGFIHPNKFEDSIKAILQIPPQVVRGIVRDVNEQIIKDIKDDLIALSEKPEAPEDVESFIEEETTKEEELVVVEKEKIIETPEENEEGIKPVVFEKEISKENQKDTEILKSAGIEIEILSQNTASDQSNKTKNTNEEENKKVLMSAGIEINPLSFGNEIKTKIEASSEEETKENEKEEQENDEIKKIAFENLPRGEIESISKKEKESNIEEVRSLPVASALLLEKKELKELSTPSLLELKEGDRVKILPEKEIKIEIEAPKVENETTEEEKIEPIKKQEDKEVPIIKKAEKEEVSTKKEEVKDVKVVDESSHTPDEKRGWNSNKKLKIATKNIIDFYEKKYNDSQNKISTTTEGEEEKEINKNPEEEKKIVIMQIIEVQEKMKIIKDRLGEIEKEINKLDKNTEKEQCSELFAEEKIIQKIREFDLPKDYLDLLEKLDKMTGHKGNLPPKQGK